ncbi:alcohol dehydrogenase catalytic domain-containing protein [Streptomyces spectabilis]|uniref:zinc-binding dehydrogenase n=1 Tax=Streptomyces spectabilis TaxID=68270 RepID=UPI0033CFFDFE
MRAIVIRGPRDVRVEEVPDPVVRRPTDAVVRLVGSCVCGSDLWAYRGVARTAPGQRMGHEFVGVVEETGSDVARLRPGDFVVAPFAWSDGVCEHCRAGLHTSCPQGGFWGDDGSDGGQGEAVRVPFADATLVPLPPELAGERKLLPALLALSDVLSTGHHAAVSAQVRPGATVAVVGDGAVGLCAVLAARRLGAERVLLLGHHEQRVAVARAFGATDVVSVRGDAAVAAVRDLTGGQGAHAVLEAVGTAPSLGTALAIARDGGTVGCVGVPYGGNAGVDLRRMFDHNIALRGGIAPVRAYIPELLPDVLSGALDPGPVFDRAVPLAEVPDGYRAMDDRSALKVRITF